MKTFYTMMKHIIVVPEYIIVATEYLWCPMNYYRDDDIYFKGVFKVRFVTPSDKLIPVEKNRTDFNTRYK